MKSEISRRTALSTIPAATLMLAAQGQEAIAVSPNSLSEFAGTSSQDDFDFFLGDWNVFHRRLKHRLQNSTDWEEFAGTTKVRRLLDGSANIDENTIELPGNPYQAMSIRTFDPEAKTWAIWWLDMRRPHSLDSPMIGEFKDGRGLFYFAGSNEGQQFIVRFIWSATDTEEPRWEQAMSIDAGATWETNWIMKFRKIDGESE